MQSRNFLCSIVTTLKGNGGGFAVYILEDLCRLAKHSPEDALHMADHFVRKLDARSPITKAKVDHW